MLIYECLFSVKGMQRRFSKTNCKVNDILKILTVLNWTRCKQLSSMNKFLKSIASCEKNVSLYNKTLTRFVTDRLQKYIRLISLIGGKAISNIKNQLIFFGNNINKFRIDIIK